MTKTSDILEFVKAIQDEQTRHETAVEVELQRLEAEGHRIVSGGQTGGPSNDEWEITDYRTSAVLATGDGYEAYVAASQAHFAHIDSVHESVGDVTPERPSWMSKELASGLQNLVWENEDEIRTLLSQVS